MGKLQQILYNLLSNAIKFTPEGGRVLLKAEADRPHVVLTVKDTGVGIAAEEQEPVFEKFRQAGNPLTREHAGTGLGLSIVRELTKLLGGDVTLQSELGRGSTFTVRLPLHLSEEPRLEFDLAARGHRSVQGPARGRAPVRGGGRRDPPRRPENPPRRGAGAGPGAGSRPNHTEVMMSYIGSALSLLLLAAAAPAADAPPPQWVVVFAPAFRDAVRPLVEHRQAQGFDITLVQTTRCPQRRRNPPRATVVSCAQPSTCFAATIRGRATSCWSGRSGPERRRTPGGRSCRRWTAGSAA